jgi:hypothetical protein
VAYRALHADKLDKRGEKRVCYTHIWPEVYRPNPWELIRFLLKQQTKYGTEEEMLEDYVQQTYT